MGSLEVKIMPCAKRDLEGFQVYLEAEAGEEKAGEVIDSILARCRSLSSSPNIGRKRDEIEPGIRTVTEGKYVIYYIADEHVVVVTRILHSSRDVKAYFDRE